MNRLAVFVEGKTESRFVEMLIEQIAGEHSVVIDTIKAYPKKTNPLTITIEGTSTQNDRRFYVLIVDCGSDKAVADRIREDHLRLTQKGYARILAVRDVRPDFQYSDVARLEEGLQRLVDKTLAPVDFVLAVMEIEAWFIAEYTHFSRIRTSITLDRIREKLDFDPDRDDLELRANPTDDLRRCYELGGAQYSKRTDKTIRSLDYARVYIELPSRFRHLKVLIDRIDSFLAE